MATNPITGKEELSQLVPDSVPGPMPLDLSQVKAGANLPGAALAAGGVGNAQLAVPTGGVGGLAPARVAVATYSFAVDGGATVVPAVNFALPLNATVMSGVIVVRHTGAVTAAGAATVALSLTTSGGVLIAATGKASFTNDAVILLTVGATPIKASGTTPDTLTVTIATGPLTAGLFDVFVNYAVAGG